MPQFTALSGSELKAVILAKIAAALDESGVCAQNVTYPWLKFTFDIKLNSYPKYAFDAEPQTVAAGEMEHKDPEGSPENLVSSLDDVDEIVLKGAETIDTPDQARVDADLPLPTPTPIVNVGVVDAPVAQPKLGKNRGR